MKRKPSPKSKVSSGPRGRKEAAALSPKSKQLLNKGSKKRPTISASAPHSKSFGH